MKPRVYISSDVGRRVDPRLGYFSRVGVAILVPVAGFFHLVWMTSQATDFTPEADHGSGIVVRTEVTEVWLTQALFDLATMASVGRIEESLPDLTRRKDLDHAWYAMTYRGHQFDGGYAVITQVRRWCEAADNLDELQVVLQSVAGSTSGAAHRGRVQVRIRIIPDHVAPNTALDEVERALRPAQLAPKPTRAPRPQGST